LQLFAGMPPLQQRHPAIELLYNQLVACVELLDLPVPRPLVDDRVHHAAMLVAGHSGSGKSRIGAEGLRQVFELLERRAKRTRAEQLLYEMLKPCDGAQRSAQACRRAEPPQLTHIPDRAAPLGSTTLPAFWSSELYRARAVHVEIDFNSHGQFQPTDKEFAAIDAFCSANPMLIKQCEAIGEWLLARRLLFILDRSSPNRRWQRLSDMPVDEPVPSLRELFIRIARTRMPDAHRTPDLSATVLVYVHVDEVQVRCFSCAPCGTFDAVFQFSPQPLCAEAR